MRKFVQSFGILFFLFSFSAQAKVSGVWKGWGEWTFQGSGSDCPTMWVHFDENANMLKRVKGFFDCGIVALHSDEQEWLKQGPDLFLDGAKAGTFTATEPYGKDVIITTTFEREGGHADYTEIWRNLTGQEIYVIRGRLFNSRDL